jgi:glycosyltransferase involved in cell wall biosynthesis
VTIRRISHVIAEFSAREAMGRTVVETATRIDGVHSLVAAHVHDTPEVFADAVALGGAMETFPLGRSDALAAALAAQQPDLVHVHGGALVPLLMAGSAVRRYRSVVTIYAWPRMPSISALRQAGVRAAVDSNVLRPRVLATSVLPAPVAARALRRAGVAAVLSPDPRVLAKLRRRLSVPLLRMGSGAPVSELRASWPEAGESPVVVFVGRAETVRGVDTLIDAFPAVRRAVPNARLRLLLLPRPELDQIVARASKLGGADVVEISTEPIPDVLVEMSRAQVGAWPFKFDYTTSPPAMAVAEALSVGLPVVSTKVACVDAVLSEGAPALTVPPQDPAALSKALITLLTDRERWAELAAAAPGFVTARLGWDQMAETTEQAYRAVEG